MIQLEEIQVGIETDAMDLSIMVFLHPPDGPVNAMSWVNLPGFRTEWLAQRLTPSRLTSALFGQRLPFCLINFQQETGQIGATSRLTSLEKFSSTLEQNIDRGVVLV